jgi:glycosyltransferase involved in cell wall biosynthesis
MSVHQLVPSFSREDAIGNHALALREILRRRWPDSWIYADHFPVATMHDEIQHYLWYGDRARPGDVLVYHASIDTPMNAWLMGRPEPLVIVYHNVTPGRFLDPYDPFLASRLRVARRQIRELVPRTALAFGVSTFNCQDLADLGFQDPEVMPLQVDLSLYRGPVDTRLMAELRRRKGSGPAVLFVGRLAPNKAHHDLLRAYRVLLESRPDALLWCPGLPWCRSYVDALARYRSALGIPVGCFVGQVTDSQLRAFFREADVFLCLSEHEGFNVPVIEAMACGVPVVAYAAASIPETLGGAGLLLDDKEPFLVAGAIERVCDDAALRQRMIDAGHARVASLESDGSSQRFLDLVEQLGANEADLRIS